MSNATVSSQVYVIRNAGALAAVDAGTMILYADGSDVFAKDASGNVYNLTSSSVVSLAFNDLTDVSVAGATSTQILQYNGTNWVAVDVFDLGELGDVSVSGATTGQVLQFNGTSWIAATPTSGGASTLNGLTDVDTTGVADGDVIVYNSGTWEVGQAMQTFSITDGATSFAVSNSDTTRFVAGTGLTAVATSSTKQIQYSLSANASDLGDVTYSSQTAGQVLQWSGTAWTNSDLSVFELSDVDQNSVTLSSTAGAGKVLAWDQTLEAFVPVSQSGGSGATGSQYQIPVFDNLGALVGGTTLQYSVNAQTITNPSSNLLHLASATAHNGIVLNDTNATSGNWFVGRDRLGSFEILTQSTYSDQQTPNFDKTTFDTGWTIQRLNGDLDPKSDATQSIGGSSLRVNAVTVAADTSAQGISFVKDTGSGTISYTLSAYNTTSGSPVLSIGSETVAFLSDISGTSGITSVDKKLAWKFLPLVSLTNANMSTNPSGTTDGLSQSFTPIYADASIGATSTATQVVHLEGLLVSDSTSAKEWYTAQGNVACLRAFKFNHFNNGDTLDITMSLSCYYVDATGTGYFVSSDITKTLTLTGTSNNTVAQFTLTAAELNTMLPANTTPAVGTVTAGKQWTCDAVFTFDNFSATATNATCTASDAHHNSGVSYAWIGFENVVPN